jgi:hypothetical protein
MVGKGVAGEGRVGEGMLREVMLGKGNDEEVADVTG